jgi:hypothetical protein
VIGLYGTNGGFAIAQDFARVVVEQVLALTCRVLAGHAVVAAHSGNAGCILTEPQEHRMAVLVSFDKDRGEVIPAGQACDVGSERRRLEPRMVFVRLSSRRCSRSRRSSRSRVPFWQPRKGATRPAGRARSARRADGWVVRDILA